jgi:hypothetical protein
MVGALLLNQPTAKKASATRASTTCLETTGFLTMRTPYGHSMPSHITLQAEIPLARAAYQTG